MAPGTKYTTGINLSDENLIKVHTIGDTWLSDSVIINVTAEEGVNYIGFGTETGSASNAVYIDNVVFTEVTDSVINVSFNTNGGNDIAPVQGLIGEPYFVFDLTTYDKGADYARMPQHLIFGSAYGSTGYGADVIEDDAPLIRSIIMDYVRIYQTNEFDKNSAASSPVMSSHP